TNCEEPDILDLSVVTNPPLPFGAPADIDITILGSTE
ncbi:hypothetical protein RR21198_4948, partial [Rhodococcus rhodochrous ATCC 21198]